MPSGPWTWNMGALSQAARHMTASMVTAPSGLVSPRRIPRFWHRSSANRSALGGGQLEQVSHLGDGLLGDMAILALGQEQQGHDCRTAAPLRVLGQDGFDLGGAQPF